jgi:hypothetical protein
MLLCESSTNKLVTVVTPSPTTNSLPPEPTPLIGPPNTLVSSCLSALIADTGSTAHFCTIDTPVINQRIAKHPISIRNPNGSVMQSTHTAELDLPHLPFLARQVHIVPALAHHSLISIGQLCDAGCDVTFDATTVTVHFENKTVLTGTRTKATKLWHLQVPSPSNHQANGAVGSATPAQQVAFAHATLFSPALSTLESALLREYLTNFPGLIPQNHYGSTHPNHTPWSKDI